MRRYILPIAAVLLVSGCGSSKPQAVPAVTPSRAPAARSHSSASPSASNGGGPRGLTGPVPTPSGQLVVAIPAGKLPYKPQPGAPALDDVKVIKTASDPCTIPPDDSGNEAQLLDEAPGGPRTLNLTFEFTNPCNKPMILSYKMIAALGGPKGASAGGGGVGATGKIEPGQSVKEVVGVDVDDNLTPEQQKQLWIGCTEIGKQDPGY